MKIPALTAAVLALALSAACFGQQENPAAPAAQGPARGPGQRGGWGGGMGGGRGVLGTVTEAGTDHYTIKTATGDVYTVHFSANTRIMKAPARRRDQGEAGGGGDAQQFAPQTLKPAEIKVGDIISAGGEVDAAAKSIGAVAILQIDPERAKQLREMEANFGKTWLMGRVTAVDGVKVTLEGGPDHGLHSFVADENTTFRKRRDPITLADVQVGDMVRTDGAVKDGSFVAATVAVMEMRGGAQGPPNGPGGAPAAPPK
jgi:hypothetical protein